MEKGEILKGLSVSSGVGIGIVHKISIQKTEVAPSVFTSVEGEKQRLKDAIDNFCYRTYAIFQQMRSVLGQEDALILGGQIFMARDLDFIEEIHQEIAQKLTAEEALHRVFSLYLSYFQEMEDEVMAQRGADLADMRDSILDILSGRSHSYNFEGKSNIVLVADDLTPSIMATLSPDHVVGILCQRGGVTSHCAILARATGIPAIFGIANLMNSVSQEDTMIVDGATGMAICNPHEKTTKKYEEKSKHFNAKRKELELFRGLSTKNAHGEKVSLMANISDFGQVHTALELGADGVGLFRTEYLFMERKELPTEEEQFKAYCRVASMMEGKPVLIRTLDIGGDKEAECLPGEEEENPFLGQRAVRFCLEHTDVFTTQLKGILRAAHKFPNISLLIPFISEIDEIQRVKAILSQCKTELLKDNIPVPESLQFGVVIETPAAAMMVDYILDEVDYVSIGTNDLTQYIMATDRGNIKVAEYYNPFHLSVIRMLKFIIESCNQRNVPVTVCGEAVADPRMIPILLSFGEVTLSVSPSSILLVRREVSSWTKKETESMTKQVLKMRYSTEIEQYLNEVIQDRDSRQVLFEKKVNEIAFGV